jgi:NAD-dependent DNA ligase
MVKKPKKSKTEEKTKKTQKGKKIKNKKKTKKEKEDKSLQKLKEIRKFYVNKKQSQMTKVQALKYLKSMVEKYNFDKTDIPFSEYLEERARKSEKINHIVETSQIFTDDVMSLTNYLEDNDFTDHDLSDIEPDYDNKNKKTKKILTQNINPNGPLNGKTIVLTGEMMIDRDDLKVILMNLGARVTSAVSSKTSMLIHGEYLEDGRKYTDGKKYQMAKKNKIEIYSDKEFEKYMQKILKRKWNMKNEAKK